MPSLADAVRALKLAEPGLGVKAIAKRVAAEHPGADTRAVRDALQHMAPSAPDEAVPPEDEEDDTPNELTRFCRVELHGLSRTSLNGVQGVCLERDAATERLLVRVIEQSSESPTVLKIKPSNVKPAAHHAYPCFSQRVREPLSPRVASNGLAGVAAAMYEQIWSGEHVSFVLLADGKDKARFQSALQLVVQPEAGIGGTDEQRTVVISIVSTRPTLNTTVGWETEGFFLLQQTSTSHLSELTRAESESLMRRVMHHALRSLDVCLLPDEIHHAFARELVQYYRFNKKWRNLEDVYTCLLDAALAGERSTELGWCHDWETGVTLHCELESQLAEVLEARGSFAEAAELYEEAASVLLRFGSGKIAEREGVKHVHNSGLAYKRAKNYEKAESLYIEALNFWVDGLEPTANALPERAHFELSQMVVLYHQMVLQATGTFSLHQSQLATVQGGPQATKRIERKYANKIKREMTGFAYHAGKSDIIKLEGALDTLLAFSTGKDVAMTQDQLSSHHACLVLPQYRSQSSATRALVHAALASQSTKSFRRAILACANPDKVSATFNHGVASDKEERLRARSQARMSDAGAHPETVVRRVCANCGLDWTDQMTQLFQLCPCKQVAYCCEKCQRAHWKTTHKRECLTCQRQ